MYPYAKFYIKVRDASGKQIISDLVGGEFATIEAINRFMSIHFPSNKAYLPLREESPKEIQGKIRRVYSIDTDIGAVNRLYVVVYDAGK